MSLNRVYAAKLPAISRAVPEGTKSGDFLMVGGRPVVALTDREGTDKTETFVGMTLTHPGSTSSNPAGHASLNVDGTYDLPVDGADPATGTGGAIVPTANDVAVYYAAAVEASFEGDPAVPAKLTLTSTNNTLFGYTNYPPENYIRETGSAPVRIGA